MSELERKVEALTDQIKALVGKGPSQVGPSAGSSASATGFASAFVDSTAKLVTGTYSVTAGIGDVTKLLGAAGGPLVGKLGEILGKVGNEFIGINTVLNQVGGSGVNFNNNLGKFTESVVSARMGLPEFARIIAENGSKIAGMSGNAQKSAEVFLQVGKDFAESPAVRQLNATGVGMEELNRVLTISAINRRNLDMNDAMTRQRVSDAAQSMAVEMDNVARLTGISRQQQEKAISDQMKKAEVEIFIASLSESQRTAYEKNTTALGNYGKEFQDVLTIYSTGGVRNAEDNAKVAAMGPKFGGLLEEMSKIKGDTTEDNERRRKIQAEMNEEALRISKNPEELRSRAQLATAAGEYGRQQATVTQAVIRYGAVLQNASRDLEAENVKREKAGQSRISLEEMINLQVKAEAEKRKAAETSVEPGALINRTEMLIKDISAGASAGFRNVNDKLVESTGKLENFNKLLTPLTKEGVILGFENFIKSLSANKEQAGARGSAARADAERTPVTSNAGGGDFFANAVRLTGEIGPELSVPSVGGRVKSNEELRSLFGGQDTEVRNMMAGLKNEMKTHLSEAKSSIPTIEQFEQMIGRMTPAAPISAPVIDANNPLAEHLQRLNTKMDELIRAVTSGSEANVRAVKTTSSNMLDR
jgi:hypothetical protein